MGGLSGLQMARVCWLLGAPLLWSAAGMAGDGHVTTPSARGPQIMFYISRPLGAHSAPQSYGLRIEEASVRPATPGLTAFSLMHRRELVDLRFAGQSDTRIEFGNRVAWDLRGRRLGPLNDHPQITLHFQPLP
jgi:hypothetical protein